MRRFQDLRLPETQLKREGVSHPGLSSITDSLYHRFRPKISNDISEFGQRFSLEALEEGDVKLQKLQLI
jgi:hypothetical protein